MKYEIKNKNYKKNAKTFFIKFSKRSFKTLSKISLGIVSIQIFFLTAIIFDNRFGIGERLGIRPNNKWESATFLISNSIPSKYLIDYGNYLKDLLISFYPSNQLDRIDLQLSFKDITSLDCDRKGLKECKGQWVKANLIEKGNSYPIKLRAKGTRWDMHRRDFKTMSFKVDIRGEKRLKGMEEFSIQKPSARNYTTELFASKVMNKFSIMSPRHFYIRLYINGEHVGIRHIEEGFGRELVESSQNRYGPVFFSDRYVERSLDDKRIASFEYEVYNKQYWRENDNDLLRQGFYVIDGLNENGYEFVNKHFDLKLWARYFAITDTLNLFHGTTPVGVRYYLNPVTGLIEPIFYNGHLGTGRWDYWEKYKFNFSDLINLEKNNCGWICDDFSNIDFYSKFFGDRNNPNIDFYTEYIKALKEITSIKTSEKDILSFWNSLNIYRGHLYRDFWRKNRWHGQGLLPHIGQWGKINQRIKNIRQRINDSDAVIPKFEIDLNKKILKTINIESEFPQIITFKCKDKKSKKFILLKNKETVLNYSKLNNCLFEDIEFSVDDENDFQFIKSQNVKDSNLISTKKFPNINKEYPLEFLSFSVLENPRNKKNLTFNPGEIKCIDNNSILHIKNVNLDIKGTEESPVKITSCGGENKMGGGIIIENSNVLISNLIVEKQKAPKLELRILYGGINFVNSNVDINNLEVLDSKSEDAINFINSTVKGNKISIKNALSDAVDLDNSDIEFKNLECSKIGNDCLDMSFSSGKFNTINADNIKDKGVSLGENSILELKELKINNAEIGVVSKDSSILKLNYLKHNNVKLPIAAYIKKPEYGSPKLYVENLIPSLEGNYLIGNDVKVIVDKKELKSSIKSSEVEKMLYGNLYGVKTKR